MAANVGGSFGRVARTAVTSYARHAGPSTSSAAKQGSREASAIAGGRLACGHPVKTSRRLFTASSRQNAAQPAVRLPEVAAKDPKLYQAVRPSPRSAYVALAHRLKLITRETDKETQEQRIALLIRACTHPTFAALLERTRSIEGIEDAAAGVGRGVVRMQDRSTREVAKEIEALDSQYIDVLADVDNASLAALGNSLLGLIASEYLHSRYPNLPNRVLKAALSAYVGPTTLSDVAAELGITAQGIVRWDRHAALTSKNEFARRTLSREAFADAMRAVVALIFQEQGMAEARAFVHAQLLSRLIPIVELLKFDNPKRSLSLLMKKLGQAPPQSRMVAETGRLTINPIFVVGVWSGNEKLGEGTGSAIRMAEYRAAEDALRRFYLSETPSSRISLPSVTLDDEFSTTTATQATPGFGFKDIWTIDSPVAGGAVSTATSFQPGPLGKSEVVFGSKG